MLRKFVFVTAMALCAAPSVFSSAIYTFSVGSGSLMFGFTAILPNLLNLAVGQIDVIPGSMLSACTFGVAPGGNLFCSSATVARSSAGGTIAMYEASNSEPSISVPVGPEALFANLTFGQPGTFLGNLEIPNMTPATLTIQAAPEPGTLLVSGLAFVLIAGVRLKHLFLHQR